MSKILTNLNQELASLSYRALESVVQIKQGQGGVGAGIIWQSDGLILTNAHVVQSRRSRVAHSGKLKVVLHDGRTFPARVLAVDPAHDLAAIRVDTGNLKPIDLGDARRLHPGDLVIAFGFPWGISGGATSGVVIGIGTDLPELANGKQEWLAASLHLRPGHSGGPMLDGTGKLVGINTLMTGPDVGVAVPSHVAVNFLKSALSQNALDSPAEAVETVTV